MISLNKVQLLGNLTRDPELKYIPSGQAVVSFGIATNRRWNDKDGNPQEDTQFHDITAWGKTAEIISNIFKKGNKIYIEGRLQTRSWEAPDGAKRSKTEIILENFIPLTPKNTTGESFFEKNNPNESISTAKTQKESNQESKTKEKKSSKKEEFPTSDEDVINLDDIPF